MSTPPYPLPDGFVWVPPPRPSADLRVEAEYFLRKILSTVEDALTRSSDVTSPRSLFDLLDEFWSYVGEFVSDFSQRSLDRCMVKYAEAELSLYALPRRNPIEALEGRWGRVIERESVDALLKGDDT